jgi:salicylate hydroxylase
VVRESLEVGLVYFLVHPDFGNNLEKTMTDAKRPPKTWWHDLEADVKKAEDSFTTLKEKENTGEEIAKSEV